MSNCNKNEGVTKDVLYEEVRERAPEEGDDAVVVSEAFVKLRAHHEQLRQGAACVDRMVERLQRQVGPAPTAPCQPERQALLSCYRCHKREALDCGNTVAEFSECARNLSAKQTD